MNTSNVKFIVLTNRILGEKFKDEMETALGNIMKETVFSFVIPIDN